MRRESHIVNYHFVIKKLHDGISSNCVEREDIRIYGTDEKQLLAKLCAELNFDTAEVTRKRSEWNYDIWKIEFANTKIESAESHILCKATA